MPVIKISEYRAVDIPLLFDEGDNIIEFVFRDRNAIARNAPTLH
jgi:hypothetical protein